MRNFVILLFIIAAAVCAALLLAGVPLAPPAVTDSSVPAALREDILYAREQKKKSKVDLFFSQQEAFHSNPVTVAITSTPPEAQVYYTLDGSLPTTKSARYTAPIELPFADKVTCTVIRAIAVNGDDISPPHTKSYFTGKDIDRRFTSYVFSLASDPKNLFDHEYGILVPGKKYEDFMRANPDTDSAMHRREANFNEHGMDWERPVHVEAFTPEGRTAVSQNAGVRVHGESSRALTQKSLRLMARKRYEPRHGRFKYPFFPEYVQANAYKTPILSYDAFILSNGGSLYAGSTLKDPVLLRIARDAGYAYASPSRSCAVYLNGDYYGHAWLFLRPNAKQIKDLYGLPDEGDFTVLEGGGHKVYTKHPVLRFEFAKLLSLANEGLTGSKNFEEFSAALDVSNFLFYMAIELYVANRDWPRSNMRIWRYTGKADAPTLPKELDGRWRYILYDLQYSMSDKTIPGKVNKEHYSYPSIEKGRESITFLNAVLKRPDLQKEFANYMCDLAFVHFSEKNVKKTADNLLEESLPELKQAAAEQMKGNAKVSLDRLNEQYKEMLVFSEKRPEYILKELREQFGFTSLYQITLEGPGKINTVSSGEGWYFVENSVPVTPDLPKWHVLDHWLVNGEKRTGQTLLISAGDAVDGRVDIKLVSRQVTPSLYLADAYDHGGICGFSLKNSTGGAMSTLGLYLTDKPHKPKKWPMPDLAVAPGGAIEFVGQSYRSTDAMLKVKLNFNPRRGEVVILTNEAGEVLDYIAVP